MALWWTVFVILPNPLAIKVPAGKQAKDLVWNNLLKRSFRDPKSNVQREDESFRDL
jgi:hypothetical protein